MPSSNPPPVIARWSPASLAKSCATSRSTPNASMSPDSQQEARRRPSWDRSIRTSTLRLACIPAQHAGVLPANSSPQFYSMATATALCTPLTVTRPSCGLRQVLSCGLPLGGAKSPAGQHTPVRFTRMARDIRFWNIGFCMILDMAGQVALRVCTPNRAAQMPAARWRASFSRSRGRQPDLAYEGWNEFELCHR
jgi:hypothetical protein